jgi:hypothetical protein
MKFDVIYEKHTIKNIDAPSEEYAKIIADMEMKKSKLKDVFVKIYPHFQGLFYSNRG